MMPACFSGLAAKEYRSRCVRRRSDVPWFVSLLVSWLPFIALVGVWIFLARQVQGARGTTQRRADEVDQLKRHISELQKQLDERSNKDKK